MGVWRGVLTFISLLLIGLGIGWLTGLSSSPVVNLVIAGVIGLVTAFNGSQAVQADKKDESQLPMKSYRPNLTYGHLAIVVAGIIVGSSAGVLARTHEWLGAAIFPLNSTAQSREIDFWVGQNLDKEFVVNRLFSNAYPANSVISETDEWAMMGLDRTEVAYRLFANTYPFYGEALNEQKIEQFEKVWSSQELSNTVVSERLFELAFPVTLSNPIDSKSAIQASNQRGTSNSGLDPLLFGADGSECRKLNTYLLVGDSLQTALSKVPTLNILSAITDTERLQTFVEVVLKCQIES